MDEAIRKLLCELSMTPARREDLQADLGIDGAQLQERIERARGLGIQIDETLQTVRIAQCSWPKVKAMLVVNLPKEP
jgi:uncharacterized membrane protein